MTPLHVATLRVTMHFLSYQTTDVYIYKELIKEDTFLKGYEWSYRSLPYLCTKNETIASLHVATLRVQRELPIHACD